MHKKGDISLFTEHEKYKIRETEYFNREFLPTRWNLVTAPESQKFQLSLISPSYQFSSRREDTEAVQGSVLVTGQAAGVCR